MRAEILSLGRSSLVYGAGQVLLRVISLLLLPVFTSYLTPSDYGVISVLSLATFFLGPVFAFGVPSAIGLVYYDDPAKRTATIITAVALMTGSGLLLVVASAATAPWLVALLFPGTGAGRDLSLLLMISVTTAALANMTQPLQLQLQLERRARTFVALTVSGSLITVGLSVVTVVGMRAGVIGLMSASLAGQLAAFVVALVVVARGGSRGFDRRIAGALFRIGMPLTPSFLFLFVIQQSNRYVIQLERGLGDLGVYTVGFNLGYAISIVVSGFTSAWFPFFLAYSTRQDEARSLFGRITSYYVLGFGSVTLLFFIAARPAILVLTHSPFHGAYEAVGASAAAQFLIGLESILLAGVYFAKEVRTIPLIQGVAAVAAVALNLALIGPFGVLGAAVALIAGCGAIVVLQYAVNRWRGYLDVGYERERLAPFIVAFVGLAVVYAWPRDLPLGAELGLSVAGTVIVAVILLRLLTPSERRLLFEIPRRIRSTRETGESV